MRLQHKTAIITGAASGIGRTTAQLFARKGAQVVVADRNDDGGHQTVQRIEAERGTCCFLHADVAVPSDVVGLISATLERYGQLDIVVNNAAISFGARITETSEEDWDRVHSVNLRGVFLCCKYAISHMQQQGHGGAIVNIASVNGYVGIPAYAAYNAAKGGVIALTRQLAIDYAAERIRVNCICPGGVDTPMARAGRSQEEWQEEMKQMAQDYPLGRIGKPEDIAYAALYLASEEASFVTGVILPVDGGWTAR